MKRAVYLLLGGLISLSCWAELDPQSIAVLCVNCHNPDETTRIPALKQLSASEISQKLINFKHDNQPATIMPRIAKGYSDQELAAVAAWLGRH